MLCPPELRKYRIGRVGLEPTTFLPSQFYRLLASPICIPAVNGTGRDRNCGAWSFNPSLYHLSYRPIISGNLPDDQIIHFNIPQICQDDKIVQCWHCLSVLPLAYRSCRYPAGFLYLSDRHSGSFPYLFYLFSSLLHINRHHLKILQQKYRLPWRKQTVGRFPRRYYPDISVLFFS